MLSTMTPAPAPPHLPIFNFDFTAATSHRPAYSSPLTSSPLRASHPSSSSSSPLAPRDPNSLAQRDFNSSPTGSALGRLDKPKWTKFDARETKKNPLKQNRESASEGRRKLFLKNVRQRQDDKAWERRGGDQEVLKLEWSTLDRRRRLQKDTDIDGLVFEEDLEDIPEYPLERQPAPEEQDNMMVDSYAMEEAAELEAMLSAYEAQTSQQMSSQRPNSPPLSDDEYDDLFMDLLSQPNRQQQDSGGNLALSGQMDLS